MFEELVVRSTEKASEGVCGSCVVKVKILSIPDGAHIVRKWVGRVGERSAERTSQNGIPISRRNTETDRTCIQGMEVAMRSITLPRPCLWGDDSFVFSRKPDRLSSNLRQRGESGEGLACGFKLYSRGCEKVWDWPEERPA
jgi:hypothetical protein